MNRLVVLLVSLSDHPLRRSRLTDVSERPLRGLQRSHHRLLGVVSVGRNQTVTTL